MVLLISYDLIGHERPAAYERVKKLIESAAGAGNFIKPLYSQWLVDTADSPTNWRGYLQQSGGIDADDRLLISEITPTYAGWLGQDAVDWLKGRVR